MTVTILDSPPRLGALYARAALGALRPRSADALPPTVLERRGVVADPGQIADYARLCGFVLDGVLPPTFAHLLAFPLQVAVMTERAFPLALPGLVHVHNTMRVHRPARFDEALDLSVHAANLRPHRRGVQVDLHARARIHDEPVWEAVSTYLARADVRPDPRPGAAQVRSASGDDPVPSEGPPTAVWRVAADTGRRYAAVSGDVNPIHLHPLTARMFGFARPIAHGMWTAARALSALHARLPETFGYEVSFGRPLRLPSTVELRTRCGDGAGDGATVQVRSGSCTHLVGTVRLG